MNQDYLSDRKSLLVITKDCTRLITKLLKSNEKTKNSERAKFQ